MAPRPLARSLPGHLATALAALVTTGLAVSGTASMFYEGWGQPLPHLLAYVAPAGVLLVLCLVALRWPRAGGLLLLAIGLAAVGWWLNAQAERGMVPLDVLLLNALTMIAPVAATTALFLLEARHRRLLLLEGAAPSSRWIARNARYILVAGVPLAAVAILASVRLPELLARRDDGQRGRRTTAGSGVTLTCAPLGPGWNGRLDTGEYPVIFSSQAAPGTTLIEKRMEIDVRDLGLGHSHVGDTTHLDALDRQANMVAATPSGGWLADSPVIPGLGFPLGSRGQMGRPTAATRGPPRPHRQAFRRRRRRRRHRSRRRPSASSRRPPSAPGW